MDFDYAALGNFKLSLHGDRQEQQFWRTTAKYFPSYEILWCRYIVPLTNRLDFSLSLSGDRERWIRFRGNLPHMWEVWAMHHYSVFYFLGRATQKIDAQDFEHPEDIFALLDACADNVREFFKRTNVLMLHFKAQDLRLPTQKKDLYLQTKGHPERESERGGFVEIQRYRDTILHNPVLGRGENVGRQFLPKRDHLDNVKHSWRAAEQLTASDLIDSETLLRRLHAEAASFLEHHWKRIISALDDIRECGAFRAELLPLENEAARLENMLATTAQPVAASGTHMLLG